MTSNRVAPLTTAALLTTVAAAHAAPTLITTAQGRGADTQIRGGDWSRQNFGDSVILRVKSSTDIGGTRKTYLRFDLKSLPKPVQKVSGVTLGLQLAATEGHTPVDKVWTFDVSGLKDGVPSEAWGEKDVLWNGAPANDATTPAKLTSDAVSLGSFTITGAGIEGQQIAFSSPKLTRFLRRDTDGLVTFIITRREAGDDATNDIAHIFDSKESPDPAPPILSVAYKGEKPALPTPEAWTKLPARPAPYPYEPDIEAFEKADALNPPSKGQIVFVGSSSIRFWKSLATDFPDKKVLNRGFGGSHVLDSVHFAQRIVTPYQPKMIVYYSGTNDIADNMPPETIFAHYKAFVAKVREKLPTTPIAFISISPTPARWSKVEDMKKANSLIENFSNTTPNLKFIDIFPLMLDAKGQPRPELYVDNLHMNPTGYAIWVKAVAPFLPAT